MDHSIVEARVRATQLLDQMSLQQKIGQLVQVNGHDGHLPDELCDKVRQGLVGSVINEVNPETVDRLQEIARQESEHGVPLLIGRDVIHGFKTVMPIPLGMAASWHDDLVAEAAEVAVFEASAQGVNWTFSPMLDVSRDPRWGRIAESFGEDPLLTGRMGAAMVKGYAADKDRQLLSCVKHFVGYGASESGRDYNTTNIPEIELRNVYLPPFLAAIKAGALSLMPSFSDLNGMPPSGSAWLMRDILRTEWGFEGFVVSDWESITQLSVHGITGSAREAALKSAHAGVNMDMASDAYANHLEALISDGELAEETLDDLVREVLTAKYFLGLFEQSGESAYAPQTERANSVARQLATESIVLLKNEDALLPLKTTQKICLIGPLADQPYEQLGTWIFDGDVDRSVSVLAAMQEKSEAEVSFCPGLWNSRDRSHEQFESAKAIAASADVVVLVLGEEAILSGEAHCRGDITLPGAQSALVDCLRELGKPMVSIVMAGRPLALGSVASESDALLYAWHPGSMAGPALCDLLYGDESPSGKLPVTLPRSAGQIPIYYAHRNTGKPPTPETVIAIDDIDARAPQLSVGNTSFHLDVDPSPQYAFGHGLSYSHFEYTDLRVEQPMMSPEGALCVAVELTNRGGRAATEIAQLYIRDPVASVTRPVRELKAYERVSLEAGETRTLQFELRKEDVSFFDGSGFVLEPGRLDIWVGGSSEAELHTVTEIYEA